MEADAHVRVVVPHVAAHWTALSRRDERPALIERPDADRPEQRRTGCPSLRRDEVLLDTRVEHAGAVEQVGVLVDGDARDAAARVRVNPGEVVGILSAHLLREMRLPSPRGLALEYEQHGEQRPDAVDGRPGPGAGDERERASD